MTEEAEGEKQHDPSQKRLEDARNKGQIARSPDLTAAAGYAGLLLAASAFGARALRQAGEAGTTLLSQSDRLATDFSAGGAAPMSGVLLAYAGAAAPLFLLPALAALAALFAQNALLFTGENLLPKLSRLSPVEGLKGRFGRQGLFEFGKTFAKLLLISGLLGLYLARHGDEILGTLYLDPGLAMAALMRMLLQFMLVIVILSAAIGGIDYLWQALEHLRRNRMSRQDLMEEMKGAEGDPQMKAQRRRRGYDIATNRMLTQVAQADVVVVNPTHYAVALKWRRGQRRAPVCLAKGVDEIALRIREAAAEAGVPLHHDPATARALHASVKLGQEILPEHYRAVAAAIRFAEAMRRKRRGGR
ncbi:MAG: type secretion exporter [Cereibacter sp.]|jgi:flagellar biosynthetic protein FlhB|nr:type secretion exporter [Cereibacter sp.]